MVSNDKGESHAVNVLRVSLRKSAFRSPEKAIAMCSGEENCVNLEVWSSKIFLVPYYPRVRVQTRVKTRVSASGDLLQQCHLVGRGLGGK